MSIFVVYVFLVFFLIVFLLFLVRLFLHRTALIYVLRKWGEWIDDRVHVHQHLKVPEFNENCQQNQFYQKVSVYLNSLASVEDSDFTNLFSGKKSNDIVLCLDDDQTIQDTFLGARVSWINEIERNHQFLTRSFVLKIKKKDKRRILKPYLQHIHTVSDDIEQRRRELKLHINTDCNWRSLPFEHPANFDSIALDPDLKNKVKFDLETFIKSKQYYHKLGRAWKRSYLLYGPSGTGKSSFIAAMANFLSYDVYNVNLSQVAEDSHLNMILLQTTSKSLIVVEDLDRYICEKSTAVTSSGLMNFMDGILGSSFCDGRIMVFTMNSKEGIDSAVLRPGRIDVHIYFPMCDFNSFKSLAGSYLGVKEHKLFPQVEEIFQSGATMSPAEIGELMLVNRSSPSRALKSVITALQSNGRSSSGGGGGKLGHRLSESAVSSPAPSSTAEDAGGTAWKDTVVPKEFRKLYGLLRLKSCKKPGSLDHDHEMIER
ncbi:P-loop containing nucleoside triphosphate hydrolase superfamily protein [Abeliophyllum distichum]|uniref:P-loop containing nucleoside triphosphate hydrolase superfamily protein n=1 Tax=Abeliophyllum distichum TaxID=126358 RepID=A0ABD1PEF1_9LAMI